jgi:hypothetical protein
MELSNRVSGPVAQQLGALEGRCTALGAEASSLADTLGSQLAGVQERVGELKAWFDANQVRGGGELGWSRGYHLGGRM